MLRINVQNMFGTAFLDLLLYLLFQYFAECHAVIYMVDSADRERMGESKEAFGL